VAELRLEDLDGRGGIRRIASDEGRARIPPKTGSSPGELRIVA
jgi:hypothetical protein